MGKLALLLVAAAAIGATYSAARSGQSGREAADGLGAYDYRVVARSAAQAGVVRAQHALLQSFSDTDVSGSFEGVPYETDVTVDGDEALIVSVARMPANLRTGDVAYEIKARIQTSQTWDPTVQPPFMDYAVIADGDITISGRGGIVDVGQPGATGQEILLHANGNLHVQSAAARINGKGSYTGTATGRASTAFVPPDAGGASVAPSSTAQIDMPPLDPAQVLAAQGGADVTSPVVAGAARLTGPLPGGPRDNPMVYYVPGNAQLVNVVVAGYAVFVVEGDASLSGVVTGTPTQSVDGVPESAVAIYTTGGIAMGGNTRVYGQLFSGESVSYTGRVDIWGSLAARGDLTLGGNTVIHARATTPTLSMGLGTPIDGAFRLTAYSEQ